MCLTMFKLAPIPHSNSFHSGKAGGLVRAQLFSLFHVVKAGDFYGYSCCQLYIFIDGCWLDG